MNFSFYRTGAIVLRQAYLFPKSFDRISDCLFWPVLDVLLWGLASQWISQRGDLGSEIVLAILTGILFWRIVWASNYEVGVNLLEECWNRNFTNIVSTPLTKLEWIVANLFVGIVKLISVIAAVAFTIKLTYELNIFSLGWYFIPLSVSLMISGWCIGFLASALILFLGIRAQALAWTLAFIFAPLSAAYFPLEFLPSYLQPIALALPTTHIFEGMRSLVLGTGGEAGFFLKSMMLNLVYLVATLAFFNYAFEATRERGFDHLE